MFLSGKAASPANRITAGKESWKKDFEKNGVLYLLFLPLAIYFIIFNYIPMGGVLMAFENFKIGKDLPELVRAQLIACLRENADLSHGGRPTCPESTLASLVTR